MSNRNEQHRKDFSVRLQAELKRVGLDIHNHTKLTKQINQQLPSIAVSAQAVRKWLLGETYPSQDKMILLADWLAVSVQWLRYGTGERVIDHQDIAVNNQQARMIFGYEYIRLIPLLDQMASLTDRDIRVVEALVIALRQEKAD